jgi:hypothetical protein
VFEGLRKRIGLNAKAILKAEADVLVALATMGGMRPKVRVFRWQEIARITLNLFGGDLNQILKLPYGQAKNALKQFPNIGDPGAEKILMFCGASPGLSPHQAKNGLDGGTALPLGMERLESPDTRRIRTVAEELWRGVPISTGSIEAGASAQGRSVCPRASLAAATWKRILPGQISAMLSVSHQGAVRLSGQAGQDV